MKTLRKKLLELEQINVDLHKLKAPIDKKLKKNWEAIKVVRKSIDEEDIATMLKLGVDWKFLLKPANDFGSTEMYNYFDTQVHELGMHSGGRWRDTRQPVVSIMLTHGDEKSLMNNIAGVKLLSPFYEQVDGAVPFAIFDHGLSEYAVYSMTYNPTTNEVILKTLRHGRTEENFLGALPDAMKHIQDHHWYDGKEEDHDDDDY